MALQNVQPGSPCTVDTLKALWMGQAEPPRAFTGPSERYDHEEAFERLIAELKLEED